MEKSVDAFRLPIRIRTSTPIHRAAGGAAFRIIEHAIEAAAKGR
jgi:hypothetical protein